MRHLALNQAFVDALHGSFLIVGIVLLVTAVLAAFFLGQKQPARSASGEPPNLPEMTRTNAM